jgi:hypothetical protein
MYDDILKWWRARHHKDKFLLLVYLAVAVAVFVGYECVFGAEVRLYADDPIVQLDSVKVYEMDESGVLTDSSVALSVGAYSWDSTITLSDADTTVGRSWLVLKSWGGQQWEFVDRVTFYPLPVQYMADVSNLLTTDSTADLKVKSIQAGRFDIANDSAGGMTINTPSGTAMSWSGGDAGWYVDAQNEGGVAAHWAATGAGGFVWKLQALSSASVFNAELDSAILNSVWDGTASSLDGGAGTMLDTLVNLYDDLATLQADFDSAYTSLDSIVHAHDSVRALITAYHESYATLDQMEDQILDADTAGHGGTGTVGEAIQDAAAGGTGTVNTMSTGALQDVWDYMFGREATLPEDSGGYDGTIIQRIMDGNNQDNWAASLPPDDTTKSGNKVAIVDDTVSGSDMAGYYQGAAASVTDASIYTYFTNGSNEDAFKADVSALALEASLFDPTTDTVVLSDSNNQAIGAIAGAVGSSNWSDVQRDSVLSAITENRMRTKVWQGATSTYGATSGSFGKLLSDYLDASISSRSSHSVQDIYEYDTSTGVSVSVSALMSGTNTGEIASMFVDKGLFVVDGTDTTYKDSSWLYQAERDTLAHLSSDSVRNHAGDFKANVAGLSTFDATSDDVTLAEAEFQRIRDSVWLLTGAKVLTALGFVYDSADFTAGYFDSAAGTGSITASISDDDKKEIAGYVDDTLTTNHGSGYWTASGLGTGAYSVTVVLVDTVGDTTVRGQLVYANNLSQSSQPHKGTTSSSGEIVFNLDAGDWVVFTTAPGYAENLDTITVTGSQTDTLSIYKGTTGRTWVAINLDDIRGPMSRGRVKLTLQQSSRDELLVAGDTIIYTPSRANLDLTTTGYQAVALYPNESFSNDSTWYECQIVTIGDRNLYQEFKFRVPDVDTVVSLGALTRWDEKQRR